MIKLSKLTDYAVVTLATLAKQGGELVSASSLSEISFLPEPTVSKVLKLLVKADIVKSVRGAKGGYVLNSTPDKIMISDVIEAIEGPIALTSCVKGSPDSCAIEGACQLNGRWNVVNTAIKTALDQVTLADMMPAHMLRKIDNSEEGARR